MDRLLAGSSEQLGQLGAVEAVERSSCYLVDLQRNCCSRLQVFQNLPIVHYRCWFGAMLTVWYLLMTLWYLLMTVRYLLMTVLYLLMMNDCYSVAYSHSAEHSVQPSTV